MEQLDPTIHRISPVPTSTHGHGDGAPRGKRGSDDGAEARNAHGDRADLSVAARARMGQEPVADLPVHDAEELAEITASAARASLAAAGAVHTRSIFRAARLLR